MEGLVVQVKEDLDESRMGEGRDDHKLDGDGHL